MNCQNRFFHCLLLKALFGIMWLKDTKVWNANRGGTMIIKNVKIYTEEKTFTEGEILIRDGLFAEVRTENKSDSEETNSEEILDGDGAYVIPGLIDLHFHGCVGHDVCDADIEALTEIARYEARNGVTAICPATMTLPVKQLEQILAVAAAYKKEAVEKNPEGADLVGINMEGPFISKMKKGAQDPRNIIPCDVEIANRFLDASEGLVKFIGLAPEDNVDFEDYIEQLKNRVHISLAHTNADYESAAKAFAAGADHAVHLYNAMPAFTHREPGVVGAVADYGHVNAEIICDGVHIHPAMVRSTFKMLGAERMILVSDSIRACGMPDGRYLLGGLDVDVKGKRAVLVSDGALAGSATNLMDCMKTAVKEMGIPLETAVACATMNPAKALGVYEQYGSISAGKKANLVLLDKELNTKVVIKDGRIL